METRATGVLVLVLRRLMSRGLSGTSLSVNTLLMVVNLGASHGIYHVRSISWPASLGKPTRFTPVPFPFGSDASSDKQQTCHDGLGLSCFIHQRDMLCTSGIHGRGECERSNKTKEGTCGCYA